MGETESREMEEKLSCERDTNPLISGFFFFFHILDIAVSKLVKEQFQK